MRVVPVTTAYPTPEADSRGVFIPNSRTGALSWVSRAKRDVRRCQPGEDRQRQRPSESVSSPTLPLGEASWGELAGL